MSSARLAPARRPAEWARAHASAGQLVLLGLFLGVFFFWPVVDILLRSLSEQARPSFDGLYFGHYEQIVSSSVLQTVIKNTLVQATLSTFVTLILAFPTAYLISRLRRRWSSVLVVLILLPFWVSILVRLIAFTALLAPDGPVKDVVGFFGVSNPQELLLQNTGATIIGMVNYLLPFMIVILYGSMANVQPTLLSAAKSLGASSATAFRRVYFPLVRGAVIGGTLLTFVIALGFFLTPAVLGGPQNATTAVYIQQQVNLYDWGEASAVGIALLVVSIVGFAIAVRFAGLGALLTRLGGAQKGTASFEPLRFSPLAVVLWLFTGLGLLVLLAPIALLIPMSVATSSVLAFPPRGFTLDWFSEIFEDPAWWPAILRSLRIAALTAALATIIAVFAARAIQRVSSQWARTLALSAVYTPLIVPVILFAIGTYAVQGRIGLLESTIGLVGAHTVLALPFAFAVVSNALAGLDRSLEEAAWASGASRLTTMRRIVLPAIAPSILGAFLLAFVVSWDDAVVSLFQTGLNKTLPVEMFAAVRSNPNPLLAAIGTLMIGAVVAVALLGAVVKALYGWRRRHMRRKAARALHAPPAAARERGVAHHAA